MPTLTTYMLRAGQFLENIVLQMLHVSIRLPCVAGFEEVILREAHSWWLLFLWYCRISRVAARQCCHEK